jgi:hypothetical protein
LTLTTVKRRKSLSSDARTPTMTSSSFSNAANTSPMARRSACGRRITSEARSLWCTIRSSLAKDGAGDLIDVESKPALDLWKRREVVARRPDTSKGVAWNSVPLRVEIISTHEARINRTGLQ